MIFKFLICCWLYYIYKCILYIDYMLFCLLKKPPKTIDRANRQGPTQATTFEGPLCTGWSLRIGACPVPKLFFHTKNMYHLISFCHSESQKHQSVYLNLEYLEYLENLESRALVISDLFWHWESPMFWWENSFETTSNRSHRLPSDSAVWQAQYQ